MKTPNLLRLLALPAALILAGTPVFGATLKIGDPAPALQVAKWVQGDAVQSFDAQHVYIVEFWATWCGPCKVSIPHLNEVWQKFKDKDLIVIGQDCWERNETNVAPFVAKMGDKMTYRVALDDKSQETNGAMAINWMKAAGQNGIPTAFIVNRQGKIAWIGHPMTLEDSVVEDILADKFDSAAYAQKFEKQQQEQEQQQALSKKLNQAMQGQDWDTADKTLSELEKILPETSHLQVTLTRMKILVGRKDFASAGMLAESTSDAYSTNIPVQNLMAWSLATAADIDAHGLAIAQKIALQADAASKGTNCQVLDTLARVQFMTGKTNEAVTTEQKAVDLAPEQAKSHLQKHLADYQAGTLPGPRE